MTPADLKKRREAAKREKDLIQPLLDECYDYVIPYRRPTGGSRGDVAGTSRVNRIFDQTAVKAAMRFPGKLQQDLCPPEQDWFTLEPGPVGEQMPGADQLAIELEKVAKVLKTGVTTGEWDTAFHEMATDILASTGFMLMLPDDEGDAENWARCIAVPGDEMLIEPGRYNDIRGIFWGRKFRNDVILDTWPDGKFGDEFKKIAAEKPHDETMVFQDTVYDRKQRRWCLYVSLEGQDAGFIHEEKTRTCPWLTPRYFKLPGETWGRGLAMVAMPSVKTLNKAVELTLKAAAIAMLGIYTYTPHAQFNPDTARIEPGQFWPVASNGGVLGEGIKKFEPPRLDLSQIVLNELRMGVEATLLDQALPPDGAAVRSATEIVERVKQLAQDYSGAFGRLVKEIVIPASRRLMEIAYDKKLIPTNVPIDQLLVRVRVTSPMAQARRVAAVQRVVNFLAMAAQIAPQETAVILDKVELLADLAVAFGVERKYIFAKEKRDEIKARVQELIAQALAAAQAAEQPQPQQESAPPAPAAA